jgi:hypothetical protein
MSVLDRVTIKEVLELSDNPTRAEIDRNYRRLVKQWHPDVNKSQEVAECMKRINKAYAIVTGKEAPPSQPMPQPQGTVVVIIRTGYSGGWYYSGTSGTSTNWRR